MAMDQFRKYMAPDFQAPQGPIMDWQQMGSESEGVGQDVGSILKLLKPKEKPLDGGKDAMMAGAAGKGGGGGMNSL